MKKSTVLVGAVISLSLAMLVLNTGCGNSNKSASSPAGLANSQVAPPTGSVPGAGSVGASLPQMIGNYTNNKSGGCVDSDGTVGSRPDFGITEERLVVSSQQVVITDIYNDGCSVAATYEIAGFDAKRLALRKRAIQLMKDGVPVPETDYDCKIDFPAQWNSTPSALVDTQYRFASNVLELTYGPVACNAGAGEKDLDVYQKQ